jgi:succinate-semialdehyde dehydrogenase/glutarate-semialdehyde dehydrogenase
MGLRVRIGAAEVPTGILIGGRWVGSDEAFTVTDKYDGSELAAVARSSREQVRSAVELGAAAVARGGPSPSERSRILRRTGELIASRRNAFIDVFIAESGFTQADALNEVERALRTVEIAAEEAKRITGELVPFGGTPGQENRIGFTMRFPLGVVCAITPFNSPLNTVLHKVAPSFAAGNATVLKPSAYTPLTAALLCETLLEAGMPPEFLALLPGRGNDVGNWLLEEQGIAFYAFTGSTHVGKLIQRAAGLRRTQLELGSIASTIVCADADLDKAIPKIANAGFRKAGQVCTSVQMLFVEKPVFEEVLERLRRQIERMPVGDPRKPETLVGPMIAESQAVRAANWIEEACGAGARLLAGGQRTGPTLSPTLLGNVKPGMKVVDQEVFCPLISLRPFTDLEEAVAAANATPYGLSAGIFTSSITRGLTAARKMRFGGVHVNEASSARADVMPFGGVKDSGYGWEGPKYAIREMSEERLITINL